MDSLPYSVMEDIRSLRMELATLKGANQLLKSSIQGGSLGIYNDAGVEVVHLGAFVSNDGVDVAGITVASGGTRALQVDGTSGMILPAIYTPFATGEVFPITSGTFFVLFQAVILKVTADSFTVWVPVSVDAGTVGEVRLSHGYLGGGSTSAVQVTSTTAIYVQFNWKHGIPLQSDVTVMVEVRRVSGAGNVNVRMPPTGVTMTGHEIFGATTTGV